MSATASEPATSPDQLSLVQTTSPATSYEKEIISPRAAELLATSTDIGSTAAPDTAIATATATAPDTAADSESTSPKTFFCSKVQTYQQDGTNAPTGTAWETRGANGKYETRTADLGPDGTWKIKEGTTTPPDLDWEKTVSNFRSSFFSAHPLLAGFGFPFCREEPWEGTMADTMLNPMFPLALTLWADPVFRSVMAQSLMGPSLFMPDPFFSPWAGRRAIDQDTIPDTARSAIDTATSAPMITAN